VDGVRIAGILKESNVELHRNITGTRDLVGARTTAEQLTLVVVHDLLVGGPAHTLDEGTLDLTDVESRVQTLAEIHDNVSAEDRMLTSESVHLNLAACSTKGEVGEHLAHTVLEVPAVLCAIEAMGGHIDTVLVGLPDEILPVLWLLRKSLDEIIQTLADLCASIENGHTVEISLHGGSSGRSVGDLVGGSVAHVDEVKGDTQGRGSNLSHLGVQTLSDLTATVVDEHCAIGVNHGESTSLVQRGVSEGKTKLDRDDSDTALLETILAVELLRCSTTLGVVAGLHD